MSATQHAASDPVLERLHEVTDRIRRRAAEARARAAAKALRYGQRELPLRLGPMPSRRTEPVPRHWSDGPEEEQNAA